MIFVKLLLDQAYGNYSYVDASNIEMSILGLFLTDDVACGYPSVFREWSLNDNLGYACSGNITALEKEDNYILLTDLCSEEDVPTELKMTRAQFVKLFDDWQEKVCRFKPKEVIIKYENDEYTIETKD